MVSVRNILLVLMCCLSSLVYASAASAKLGEMLAGFTTMSSNFKQTLFDANGNIIQTTKGKMALERPGKFRWFSKDPTEQLIVTNGQTLWIYDVDLEQVTVQQLQQVLGNTPARLLTGNIETIEQDFEIELLPKQGIGVSFKLIPKNQEELFQDIQMTFVNHKLQSMVFMDNLNQKTRVKFSNTHLNTDLKADIFEFDPPEHVDVIGG